LSEQRPELGPRVGPTQGERARLGPRGKRAHPAQASPKTADDLQLAASRTKAAILRACGCGVRETARRLGRAPSTILRELRLGGGRSPPSSPPTASRAAAYRSASPAPSSDSTGRPSHRCSAAVPRDSPRNVPVLQGRSSCVRRSGVYLCREEPRGALGCRRRELLKARRLGEPELAEDGALRGRDLGALAERAGGPGEAAQLQLLELAAQVRPGV